MANPDSGMAETKKIEVAIALMQAIVSALVDESSTVSIQAVQANEATYLLVQVASEDVGKLIGKQGRTTRSLRVILSAVSMKLHHRFQLEIVEERKDGQV